MFEFEIELDFFLICDDIFKCNVKIGCNGKIYIKYELVFFLVMEKILV